MRVGQLKYIDSFQFMNSSLAKLAANIGAVTCKKTNGCNHVSRIDKNRCLGHPEKYKITMQYYTKKGLTPEIIALILRKGVFPYEYIDSHERFKETKLPPIDKFHGTLSEKCSQEDYEHAQKVWKAFNCKNLGEYSD